MSESEPRVDGLHDVDQLDAPTAQRSRLPDRLGTRDRGEPTRRAIRCGLGQS
jgi:hypothetical protein